jgi:hypothetical protein
VASAVRVLGFAHRITPLGGLKDSIWPTHLNQPSIVNSDTDPRISKCIRAYTKGNSKIVPLIERAVAFGLRDAYDSLLTPRRDAAILCIVKYVRSVS